MITLRLQGALAACVRADSTEEVLELDARSAGEALRLVAPQAAGFEACLEVGAWRILVDGAEIGPRELEKRLPDRSLVSVSPALEGAELTTAGWIMLALTAVTGIYAVTQIPRIPDTDHLQTDRRNLFTGPVNSIAQGGAVPLIYGRTRVGSTVVSGGITPDRPTGGDNAAPPAIGLGGHPAQGQGGAPAEDRHDPFQGDEPPGAASRATSTLRVVDLLGEGEIEGLADGLRSVFIDNVAVEDEDGNRDVEGVSIQVRRGLPHGDSGQEALAGFAVTATGLGHARTKVVRATPVVNEVPAGYDGARVTLLWPRLVEYGEGSSEIAAEVTFRVESRPAGGGGWTTVLTQTVRDLSLDDRELAWRVERPAAVAANGRWEIRVSRDTEDSTSTEVQDEFFWQRTAGLRDVKQSYPHSAVVGLVIETERSDLNPTRREYELLGRRVLTPPNATWNPDAPTAASAASYGAGIWDGTMVRRWTDNAAWIAYDLLTDRRAGLGALPGMLEAARNARPLFLELARRCDELVPAPDSAADMEPRWRFNGVITKREQARRVVDWVLSSCRSGMAWVGGAAALAIDGDSDVVAAIGNANVLDGEIEYDGPRSRERYSAVAVTWQNPDDAHRSTIELVQDGRLVEEYGFRQKDVAAVGCTSRGQAHRVGLLVLNEQENESERARFRMALEGMHLRPGNRIRIADELRFEVRGAWRLKAVDTSTPGRETLTLDRAAPRLAAGRIAWGEGRSAAVVHGASADVLVTTETPTGLVAGDVVVNAAAAIDWIVDRLRERDQVEVLVEAHRYDPNKYTAIEQRRMLAPPLVDPVAKILAPTAVTVVERTYEDRNVVRSLLEIGVRGGDDPRIAQVEVEIQRPKRKASPAEIAAGDWSVLPRGPWEPLRITSARSIVERNVALGGYRLRARFLGRRRRSEWTESPPLVADGKTDALAPPAGLYAIGRYEGYWVGWIRPAAHDYAFTEVWDRLGVPGSPNADVNVEDGTWRKRGEASGSGFLGAVGNVLPHRVAVRHVDTSNLRSPAREVGVVPIEVDAAAGEDGHGFEYVHLATANTLEPDLPAGANGWRYDLPAAPWTDGLNVAPLTPVGHRWRRPWPGTPAAGESPYVAGTVYKDGVGPWRYEGVAARFGLGLPPPGNVAIVASAVGSSLDITWDAVPGAFFYRLFYEYHLSELAGFAPAPPRKASVDAYVRFIPDTASSISVSPEFGRRITLWSIQMATGDEAGGMGGMSPPVEVAPPAVTPSTLGAPSLTAVAGDARVVVSWPAVPTATYYEGRHKRTSSSSWGNWITVSSPRTWGGLANGVSWDIQVRAARPASGGGTDYSNPASVTRTPSRAPAATTVTATAGGGKEVGSGGSVTLDGGASVSNGSGSTSYRWRRISGTGGSLSSSTTARPTFTAPTLTAGGQNRAIVWELTATNNGVSDSDRVTVTVTAPPDVQPPPTPTMSGSASYDPVTGNLDTSFQASAAGATSWELEVAATSNGVLGWYAISDAIQRFSRTTITGRTTAAVSVSFRVAAGTGRIPATITVGVRARASNADGSSAWRGLDMVAQ